MTVITDVNINNPSIWVFKIPLTLLQTSALKELTHLFLTQCEILEECPYISQGQFAQMTPGLCNIAGKERV